MPACLHLEGWVGTRPKEKPRIATGLDLFMSAR